MTNVEIDIFSGRPNPSWTLTADEATALARLLEQLPTGRAPTPPDLGYRGFRISAAGSAEMRVFAGTVSIGDRHLSDAHAAERWLFESARAHGHGALVDAVAPR